MTLAELLGPGLRGPWTWRKAAAAPLLMLVRSYQLAISPLLPQRCRFYPSCSAYAVTALTRFGPLRGGWLAARRLGRATRGTLAALTTFPSGKPAALTRRPRPPGPRAAYLDC